MTALVNETRSQAIDRWHNEKGKENDYIRTFEMDTAEGEVEVSHCNICATLEKKGKINHLHYCPFAGVEDE